MEYMRDDLSSVVRKKKEERRKKQANQSGMGLAAPFELHEALEIAIQIAIGMEYLHRSGITHGDLKANNIFIDWKEDKMSVKLADFGLLQTKRRSTMVSQRALCFKMMEWSAPELFEDYFRSTSEDLEYLWTKSPIGSETSTSSVSTFEKSAEVSMKQADSYSFALLCAFVLGGQMWNAKLSPSELRREISNSGLRPTLTSECPKTLRSLISLCWDANPARRPTFSYILENLQEEQRNLQEGDVKGLNAQVPVVRRPEARSALKIKPAAAPLMVKKPDVAPQQDMAYKMDVRKYSYAEVEVISMNWMHKVGEGRFGVVYYGEIFSDASPNVNPKKVALKRLSATSQQDKYDFIYEVRLLSRIHFRYLVPLVGFCDDINNQVLIYEYVQGDSLADWLHGAQRGHPNFDWYSRLLIALHAAIGLEYLHVGARPNIIHGDVKSSKILITWEWEGRVAGFGLSRTPLTLLKGTLGYLDPEYIRTRRLTTKSDVYSFGIVLLELITGRLPTDYSEKDPQLRCIEIYVQSHYPHNLATIADPNLKGNYDIRSMQKIAQVALRSVALQGINRPTMSDVVVEIRSALKLIEVGRDSPTTTNAQDEPDIGPATGTAMRTLRAFAPDHPKSRRRNPLLQLISRSMVPSSAKSDPSVRGGPTP